MCFFPKAEPTIIMSDHEATLDKLFIWLSPAFPVGAFAFSHGLERAVEDGLVAGRDSLEPWIEGLVDFGSLRNDLILLSVAWKSCITDDMTGLGTIVELGSALQPAMERSNESHTQGTSFLKTIAEAWPSHRLDRFLQEVPAKVAYPVAVGIAAAAHELPLAGTSRIYATQFVGNLLSAAIRLGVIGQTDAQRIHAALLEPIAGRVSWTCEAGIEDIGGACWIADIAAARHETQHTRLFRS